MVYHDSKFHNSANSLFFYHYDWFVRLILWNGFLIMYIPFVHSVKFELLAQISVDLSHSVRLSLILFLRWFAAFDYYMIDLTPCEFFLPALTGVFSWSMSGSKSSRDSRTFLSTPAIGTMPLNGYSRFVLQLSALPSLFRILWGPFQKH